MTPDRFPPATMPQLRRRAFVVASLAAPLLLWGGGARAFPRDPDRTLASVRGAGRMVVAASDNPPWVMTGGDDPSGVEVTLVQRFAQMLAVGVDWLRLPAFEALQAVEQGKVNLAIGGFSRASVVAQNVAAPTYTYFTERLVVAAPDARSAPADLDGQPVYVPPDLVVEQAIRDRGGLPVHDPDSATLIALPHWRVAAAGMAPTGIELARREHVLALRRGENAWLFELEQFLRGQEAAVPDLLEGAR
ncbi:MAG TPA: hypothetical protein DD444_22860 [Citreicella sp.]|jgi:polar amino acid transport system substrate-binding protein|nr:hypothetical protein [Citreicella sp.]